MSDAGWGEIWKLALAQYGTQSIQIRILIGLGVAFTALMIVEGLRISFLAGRRLPAPQHEIAKPPPKKMPVKKADGAGTLSFAVSSEPFRPRASVRGRNPKTTKPRVSRHRAARPTIQRMPKDEPAPRFFPPLAFTEEAAPFSPLPPIPEQIEV
jgi:hypothetical protein